MKLLYNFAIGCYRTAVSIAGHFNKKAQKLSHGESNALKQLQANIHPDGNYIWIHAASLGEFEQGRPLIETLRAKCPNQRILLTFFSPSGYEVRKNYDGVDYVSYLPFDRSCNVRKFLDIVKPRQAIFVKYEFWYNYLHELRQRNIPTYLISSIFRKEQIFFKPYGGMFRSMLRCFTHLYVQDKSSLELLSQIGINNATIAGDTRFDRVITIHQQAREVPLIEQLTNGHFSIVAGSSWQPDEELFIRYFNSHPELRLVIAPHEIHEEHLASIEAQLSRPHLRLSQANETNIAQVDCLIVDSFGLLSSIYRYGQVAYIGGGFGAGIHNCLEASVYGIPVIFGTNYTKFREAREMLTAQCAFSIENYQQLEKLLDYLTSHPHYLEKTGRTAHNYVHNNAGATNIIYNDLFNIK